MTTFDPLQSYGGGILIGLASVFLMLAIGRIAGISGIAVGLLSEQVGGKAWRIAFLIGLVSAPVFVELIIGAPVSINISESIPVLVVGGFLVGLGAIIGGGCTSGHGVCGVGRLSPRSIVSVAVFMTTGFIAFAVLRHGFGLVP